MYAMSINVERFFFRLEILQSWARRSALARQLKVCCTTFSSAVYLSNLFLKRSVKQQAHYFSRLETRYSKLLRIETRGTVNLLLSGTVCIAYIYAIWFWRSILWTAVKSRYPLTSTTWPNRGLRLEIIDVKCFLKLTTDQVMDFCWIAGSSVFPNY